MAWRLKYIFLFYIGSVTVDPPFVAPGLAVLWKRKERSRYSQMLYETYGATANKLTFSQSFYVQNGTDSNWKTMI